ncbi:MAG: disulfide bond formation protein B [Alphaproteobacteria bacterium]
MPPGAWRSPPPRTRWRSGWSLRIPPQAARALLGGDPACRDGGRAAFWPRAPRLAAPILMTLAAAALLYGAGKAAQHVGVVAHWWTSTCSAAKDLSIEDVMAGKAGAPIVSCDSAPQFFGVTLPAWNFVAALALASLAASGPARLFLRGWRATSDSKLKDSRR